MLYISSWAFKNLEKRSGCIAYRDVVDLSGSDECKPKCKFYRTFKYWRLLQLYFTSLSSSESSFLQFNMPVSRKNYMFRKTFTNIPMHLYWLRIFCNVAPVTFALMYNILLKISTMYCEKIDSQKLLLSRNFFLFLYIYYTASDMSEILAIIFETG